MSCWQLVTIPAITDAYAPEQVPYELTEGERSQAALYRLELERQRRERNRRDQAIQRRRAGDGPEAA